MITLKPGDKIELVSMGDDPRPIESGARGVVTNVNPIGRGETQVTVTWENGRGLMLILPHDKIRVLAS